MRPGFSFLGTGIQGEVVREGLKIRRSQGAWVAPSVERPTSAQVTSSLTACEFKPCICLSARSLAASDPLSPSLCPSPAHALSPSLSQKKVSLWGTEAVLMRKSLAGRDGDHLPPVY